MTRLHLLDLPADRLEGEAVAVFFFEDERPLRGPAALLDWRLNGQLTKMLVENKALGTLGEYVVVGNNGKLSSRWILFAGGGRWESLDGKRYRSLLLETLNACRRAGFRRVALSLCALPSMSKEGVRDMVEGVLAEIGDGFECLLSVADRDSGGMPAG